MAFSFISKNPVLKNVTDYLVEEGSFEEEELLGMVFYHIFAHDTDVYVQGLISGLI